MCPKKNKKLAEFLQRIFAEAQAGEMKLEEGERRPLTGCAILTDTGNIFGSIVSNLASHDNPDGSSPLAEVIENLEGHKTLLRTDFQISVVAVTASIDPETSEFVQLDWSFFGREKRMLTEAGVDAVLYLCPNTNQHKMMTLENE